jgi:muconolactone D-isomerase
MEFLVEFEIRVPEGTPASVVRTRQQAEAAAAATLVDGGHLARVWRLRDTSAEAKVLGLYRAASERELDGLLRALPLYEWMTVEMTTLEPHPNDPTAGKKPLAAGSQAMSTELVDACRELSDTVAERTVALGITPNGQAGPVNVNSGIEPVTYG